MHNSHNLCKNEPEMRFLAITLRLGPQMDLMLHIMVEENVFKHVGNGKRSCIIN